MLNRSFIAALLALSAAHAHAIQTVEYGWEDGRGTILGGFGNLVDASNVTGAQTGSTDSARSSSASVSGQSGLPK